jgi:hypothetical protein
VDDNLDTLWHTNWDGSDRSVQWIQFEITEDYTVTGLRYKPRSGSINGVITKYEIQVSDDGETWTKAAEGEWKNNENWKIAEIDAQNVKYVRLQTIEAQSDSGKQFASAAEIRLVGVKSEPTVCEHKKTETRNAKTATCTEDGYTGDIYCADCDELLTKGEVVNALGHNYENGTCTNCGDFKNPFTDVNEKDHKAFYDAIMWAVKGGVTEGATATTFNPTGKLLRAQFVTFLWRAAGEPKAENATNPFTDIAETDFYYDAVLWAVEKGITTGASKDTFNPMGVTNRAQAVTFLWRYLEEPAATGSNNFSDVAAGMWYTDAINWAVGAGVTNGLGDGTFGIGANCNRAQAVTFLYRAIVK